MVFSPEQKEKLKALGFEIYTFLENEFAQKCKANIYIMIDYGETRVLRFNNGEYFSRLEDDQYPKWVIEDLNPLREMGY